MLISVPVFHECTEQQFSLNPHSNYNDKLRKLPDQTNKHHLLLTGFVSHRLLQEQCGNDIFHTSLGPVYEFVCISFRTDNLNCFRAS